MSQDLQHPLRKVAILVASLDEQWAEKILADLPTGMASKVLEVAEQLEAVDPAEQQAIVKEFRRSMAAKIVPSEPTPAPPASAGVELDASLLARIESQEQNFDESQDTYPQPNKPPSSPNALSNASPAMLAGILIKEHPQTIAVALSRFEHERAANVLTLLPLELQAEVLGRLADLDQTDPQTVQAVESQLAEWLNQQQQQKKRMADGAELVQRILSNSPQAQRQTVMTRISRLKPELAGRLDFEPPRASQSGQLPPVKRSNATPPAVMPPIYQPPIRREPRQAPSKSADPLADLENADDRTLLALFSQADRRTVMLALAGASETLLKRILRGMPCRQAKQFRKQLHSLGPTRLSDMLAAQQELAHQIKLSLAQ